VKEKPNDIFFLDLKDIIPRGHKTSFVSFNDAEKTLIILKHYNRNLEIEWMMPVIKSHPTYRQVNDLFGFDIDLKRLPQVQPVAQPAFDFGQHLPWVEAPANDEQQTVEQAVPPSVPVMGQQQPASAMEPPPVPEQRGNESQPAADDEEVGAPVDNELETESEDDEEDNGTGGPPSGALVKFIDFSGIATGQYKKVPVSHNNLIDAVGLTMVFTGKKRDYANQV